MEAPHSGAHKTVLAFLEHAMLVHFFLNNRYHLSWHNEHADLQRYENAEFDFNTLSSS